MPRAILSLALLLLAAAGWAQLRDEERPIGPEDPPQDIAGRGLEPFVPELPQPDGNDVALEALKEQKQQLDERGVVYNYPKGCSGNSPYYYCDTTIGTCRVSVHGECRVKANRFSTKERCEENCFIADDICYLPKHPGPCKGQIPSYYFDPTTSSCLTFVYGGCHGNENRFETKGQCEQKCYRPVPRSPATSPPPYPTGRPDICYLPKAPGLCEAYIPAFYFDPTTSACLRFVYGGCDGNENRFNTKELCEQKCLPSPAPGLSTTTSAQTPSVRPTSPGDVCNLPKSSGPCKGFYVCYYYDSATKSCQTFVYGGCGGNGNRFKIKQLCEQRCLLTSSAPVVPTTASTSTVRPTDVPTRPTASTSTVRPTDVPTRPTASTSTVRPTDVPTRPTASTSTVRPTDVPTRSTASTSTVRPTDAPTTASTSTASDVPTTASTLTVPPALLKTSTRRFPPIAPNFRSLDDDDWELWY